MSSAVRVHGELLITPPSSARIDLDAVPRTSSSRQGREYGQRMSEHYE